MDENEPWNVYENQQSRFTFNTIANALGVNLRQQPGQGGVVVMYDAPFAAFDSNWSGRYEMSNDGSISPTLKCGGTNSRTIVRRLTPLECERLMGWPDGWTEWGVNDDGDRVEIANTHRYRICGNGIVSNVTQWLGERLELLVGGVNCG